MTIAAEVGGWGCAGTVIEDFAFGCAAATDTLGGCWVSTAPSFGVAAASVFGTGDPCDTPDNVATTALGTEPEFCESAVA